MAELFTNAELIKTCEWPKLQRKIGVQVHGPFFHHGKGEEGVEIDYSLPTLNSATYGRWYPREEQDAKVIEMTRSILARIDEHIAELQEHRERLQASLEALERGE